MLAVAVTNETENQTGRVLFFVPYLALCSISGNLCFCSNTKASPRQQKQCIRPSVPQLSACQEFTLFGRGFSWSDLFCWNVKGLVLEFFCWFTRCFVLWVDIFTSGIASRQTPHITGPHSLRCVSSCPAVLQCQCQSRLSPSLQRMTAEQSDHLLPVHNECQILKTDRIETLVFPMIIDFFKNVKTHSQIISLSPHCYSPPNLVPGSRFLWPGSKWPGPGLVTPRHSEKGPSGAEWQMVSSGEWAPGVSGLWLPKCICGKWLQLRSRDVCYVRDVAQLLSPSGRDWTWPHSLHLITEI